MPMDMIECSQEPEEMCYPRTNHETMHYLMTRTPNIEAIRIPFLGNLRTFKSDEIERVFRSRNLPSERTRRHQ